MTRPRALRGGGGGLTGRHPACPGPRGMGMKL